MDVVAYTYKYKPMLDHWWKLHNLPTIPKASLPNCGYLVQGLAAGFLYQTDSDVAFIENFISNPKAPWNQRGAALDAVTQSLVEFAKSTGIRHLMALTTSQAIYERAVRFGFKPQGAFQVLNLTIG